MSSDTPQRTDRGAFVNTTGHSTSDSPSRFGLWGIFSNLAFGVVVGTVVIVVTISRGQPLGIPVGLFMIAVGGYYAWRGWQGRQVALRRNAGGN